MQKALILVPKTGTKTLQDIAGKVGNVIADDHYSYSQMIDWHGDELELAANVRHPVDRFVSAFHYSFKNPHPKFTLDFLMNKVARNDCPQLMFKSQMDWIEHPDKVRLFNFDKMNIMGWLGWDGYVPRLNATERRFSRKDIEEHPLFNAIMERYEGDWKLWDNVQ